MKKIITIIGIALALVCAAPSYSAEIEDEPAKHEVNRAVELETKTTQSQRDAVALAKKKKAQEKAAQKAKRNKPHSVPEIDSSYAALAISLLFGTIAIRRERYRKNKT
ncbi:hypothetical protein DWB84_04165 [Saccharophagus sp. K07]|uniref:hypothetical protein n=1 Tax=Saccharophagus sp. K07 TaxID=2283636 RepID=UPI0016525F1D|nr:hypothetical protein [Saccharophagus sp. K07]MBC6904661.1 hypothetical protein [Saccharophagus sp. K07]